MKQFCQFRSVFSEHQGQVVSKPMIETSDNLIRSLPFLFSSFKQIPRYICVVSSISVRKPQNIQIKPRSLLWRPKSLITDDLIIQRYVIWANGRMLQPKLSVCLTNKAQRHEEVWRSGFTDPCFLDLGTSRLVVSFKPRSLCPWYPWIEAWMSLRHDLEVMENRKLSCPVHSQSLHQLCYPGSRRREVR
jgi:hypothetical protein